MAETDTVEEKKAIYSYSILKDLRKSQGENGLKYNDYQRYRQYCARRLRRVRKTLKVSNARHFKRVKYEITEAKSLTLFLINAERAWSYAMQLKNDITNNPDDSSRKTFHMLRRLRKAAVHAKKLKELCAQHGDARTQLEAEAYSSYMSGVYALEKNNIPDAAQSFSCAKAVYEELSKVGGEDNKEMCVARIADIEPSLRYCKYAIKRSGGAAAAAPVLSDAALAGRLEALKQESSAAAGDTAAALKEGGLVWRGLAIAFTTNERIKNTVEKIHALIAQLKQSSRSSSSSSSGSMHTGSSDDNTDAEQQQEAQMGVLSSVLVLCDEGLQLIANDYRKADAKKTLDVNKSKQNESEKKFLANMREYVSHIKLVSITGRLAM